jgi:hypothetical protein
MAAILLATYKVKMRGQALKGAVPLHHLTDNASMAAMLLATYKAKIGGTGPKGHRKTPLDHHR